MIPEEKIERQGMGYKPNKEVWDAVDIKLFAEEHKKYSLMVEEILKNYNKATNNDFILYIEFLYLMGYVKITSSKDEIIVRIDKEKAGFIPSPESITRARRSLNTRGLGLPTDPRVQEMRAKRCKTMRKYFGGGE